MPSSYLSSVEVFSGTGGLALGVHAAGFRHLALVDNYHDACRTLRHNIEKRSVRGISHWKVLEGDIREASFAQYSSLDLLAGGPPCQPFSIGGKHQGELDQRDMIPEFIRVVRETKPRAFLMENVKGLTRKSFQTYFSYILLQLNYPGVVRKKSEAWADHLSRLEKIHTGKRKPKLRYNVVFRLLNAADYGVPQVRERLLLVGFRADTGIEWSFPEPTHSKDALLYQQWVSREYWERHGINAQPMPDRCRGVVARLELEPKPQTQAWVTVRDAISDLPDPRNTNESFVLSGHHFQDGARSYVGHTGSPLDLPSKTLKAGVHGVPGGENMIAFPDGSVRYLSLREAARIQTFPDNWAFQGAWSEGMRQLGNAVPMKLAKAVADDVARALKQSGSTHG